MASWVNKTQAKCPLLVRPNCFVLKLYEEPINIYHFIFPTHLTKVVSVSMDFSLL